MLRRYMRTGIRWADAELAEPMRIMTSTGIELTEDDLSRFNERKREAKRLSNEQEEKGDENE